MNVNVYAPGADVSAVATTAVLAKRFVGISGNRTAGGNVAIAPAPAAGRAFGVARDDTAIGALVSVARSAGRVVLVKAAGAITANAEVEVGTAGQVITKATGIAVGYAITGAASGADAEISLY